MTIVHCHGHEVGLNEEAKQGNDNRHVVPALSTCPNIRHNVWSAAMGEKVALR
jgi:hypothetical protein